MSGQAGGTGDEMGRQRRDRQTQGSSTVRHSISLLLARLPAGEKTVLSVSSMLNEKPPLSPLQHGPAYFSCHEEHYVVLNYT